MPGVRFQGFGVGGKDNWLSLGNINEKIEVSLFLSVKGMY